MFKICTLLMLLLVHVSEQTCTPPVKVTILYEALCGDSVNFISNQLATNYNDIKDSVELEFVPFGKSEYTFDWTKYTFKCHFHDRECRLNKYHACGLKYASNQDNKVKFVNCLMTKAGADFIPNPKDRDVEDLKILQKCSIDADIPTAQLKSCRTSSEGDKSLADHGDRTQNFKSTIPVHKYDVPIIIFEQTFNQELQDRIRINSEFLNIINERCSQQVRPQACWYCPPGQNYYYPYSQYTYGGYGGYGGAGVYPYGYSYPCGGLYPCNNYYQPIAY